MSCSSLKFVQDQLLAFTLLPSSPVSFYSWHVLPLKTNFISYLPDTSISTCRVYSSAFKSLACTCSAVFSSLFFCFPNSLCVDYQSPAALSQRKKLSPWSCCFEQPSTAFVATLCRGLLLKSLHKHLSRSKSHVLQSCPAFFDPGL